MKTNIKQLLDGAMRTDRHVVLDTGSCHRITNPDQVVIESEKIKIVGDGNAVIEDVVFERCELDAECKVIFFRCGFERGKISSKQQGALRSVLQECDLDGTDVVMIPDSINSEFRGCDVLHFEGSHLGSLFANCQINNTFQHVFANNATFRKGEVGAMFAVFSEFQSCVFEDVRFASRFKFTDCTFQDCAMSKWSMLCMKDYGELTPYDRMCIKLIDPLEMLRKNFTGFNFWLQISFVVVFVAPYAVFIGVQWWKHLAAPGTGDEMLITQVSKYVWSGGVTHQVWVFHWSFLVFIGFLALNAARVALLVKTRQIESDEAIQGVPTQFSLKDHRGWNIVQQVVVRGAYLAPMLSTVNTLFFLTTKTPY